MKSQKSFLKLWVFSCFILQLLPFMKVVAMDWKVDAATSWNGDYVYFFSGSQYSRYDIKTAKIDSKYPMNIAGNFANGWPSGWTSVDAAANIGENVYCFKGSQYLRYDTKTGKVLSGYPLTINGNFSKNWPSGWSSVDAAVNLDNGNIYFFRGRDYIRYEIQTARVTDPKPINGNFSKGWPSWSSVDAAVNYGNGNVYFFRGDEYFRYKIDGATVSEPQKVVGNFVHPSVSTSASSLRLTKIKCIKPATGIELEVTESISDAAMGAGVVLVGVGVATIEAGPEATAAVAAAGVVVGGVSLGTWISTKIDNSRSPDQFYLKVNNSKVWPDGNYKELKGGDEQYVNINLPLNCTLELMEHDTGGLFGSGDDSMGTYKLSNFNKGTFEAVVQSTKEDSMYLLVFEAN